MNKKWMILSFVLVSTLILGANWHTIENFIAGIKTNEINESTTGSGVSVAPFIQLSEISAPANPAADKARFYCKDDTGTTKLYFRDFAGVETELGTGGDVVKTGTPADNQVTVWTGDGTIEGTTGLTYDGSNFQLTGDIGSTGTKITKGWFTDLFATNAIGGSITGNAGTVSTITGLAPDTATTQATQAAITTAVNLVSVGALNSGSIVSGFDSINVGANSITTTGTMSNGLLYTTGPAPIYTFENTTAEDSDGGRASQIIFDGHQSGDEKSSLAMIEASHDSAVDDTKGKVILQTNNGTALTDAVEWSSAGNMGLGSVPFAFNRLYIKGTGNTNGSYSLKCVNSDDTITFSVNDVGDTAITGALSKGSGTFTIDHPLDPANKILQHSFVESPEMRNMYYGQTTLINGKAVIIMPNWWHPLNGTDKAEFNYQLTCIGDYSKLYISKEMENGTFEISGDLDVKVSWQVSAIRHDDYAEANRVQVEINKIESITEIKEIKEIDGEKYEITYDLHSNKSKGFYLHPNNSRIQPQRKIEKSREKISL